jgi:hypothetical protein
MYCGSLTVRCPVNGLQLNRGNRQAVDEKDQAGVSRGDELHLPGRPGFLA